MSNEAFVAGFLMGISLIIPIGAQNAFVLKLGLLRQHILPVALLCSAMDAMLIFLGVSFSGITFAKYTWALTSIRYIGVAFLLFYGYRAFLSAYRHAKPKTDLPFFQNITLKKALLTSLGFTLLNPHVYIDTILLIGGLSVQYKPDHFYFGFGAMSASFFWFFVLGYGARFLTPLFAKKNTWTILECAIGIVMWTIAYKIWILPLAL